MRTFFISLFLFSVINLFGQESKIPPLAAKNIISLDYKLGEVGFAGLTAYERQIFRSSIVSAHGLKLGAGLVFAKKWRGYELKEDAKMYQATVTNYLGAFRHFVCLEIGISMQADYVSEFKSKYSPVIIAGYKYHKDRAGIYWSVMGGNQGSLNVSIGYTF